MNTSALGPKRAGGRHVGAHAGADVRWAWGLIAVTLPASVLAVVVLEAVAGATGTPTGGTGFGVGLYAAVAAPLVGSVVLGLRAWRAHHDALGLRAALVSAGLLVVGTTLVLLSA